MGVYDFKFFRNERPNMTRARIAFMARQELMNQRNDEWWNDPIVVRAMENGNEYDEEEEEINEVPNDNLERNNILWQRIQFLEDNLVRIRDENTQLNIEMDRLRRIRNNS